MGWHVGDTIELKENRDGSYTLSKVEKDTEIVLVEAISTFKHVYAVEVPKGKAEWALDTVTTEEAQELYQVHIGEQIIGHRVVSKEEYIKEFDTHNHYLSKWNESQKTAFITRINADGSIVGSQEEV
jgi:hypothetical protein